MGILVAAVFAVRSAYRRTRQKIRGQITFGRYMILPISHIQNWRHIHWRKQTQIEKYTIHKTPTRIYYDFTIGYKSLVRRNQDYKYETSFKVPYEIIKTWTNRTVTIGTGAVTSILYMRHIKPYNIPELQ